MFLSLKNPFLRKSSKNNEDKPRFPLIPFLIVITIAILVTWWFRAT